MGNTLALVSLYGGLGGINWIVKTGWRGEKIKNNTKQVKETKGVKNVTKDVKKSSLPIIESSSFNDVNLHGVKLSEVIVLEKGNDDEDDEVKKVKKLQVTSLDLKFNGLIGQLCGNGDSSFASPTPSRPITSPVVGDNPLSIANRNLISHPLQPSMQTSHTLQDGSVVYEPIESSHTYGDMLNMPALKTLNLSGNSLSGVLPSGPLAALIRLEVLNLSQNRLSGVLPQGSGSLSCLTRLKTLSLRHNLLKVIILM